MLFKMQNGFCFLNSFPVKPLYLSQFFESFSVSPTHLNENSSLPLVVFKNLSQLRTSVLETFKGQYEIIYLTLTNVLSVIISLVCIIIK